MRFFYLVAPTVVVRSNDSAYTYHSDQPLKIGSLVRVSVGKQLRNGVIVDIVGETPRFKTKPIETVLTNAPLPIQLVELATWLSDYYATHLALVLQTLLPTGLHKSRRTATKAALHPSRDRTTIVLSSEQKTAVKAIGTQTATTFLLHGVTGSGKTQVYIEAAKHQAKNGRSTIILVPEIALTPQLTAEFSNHFENLLLTHSGLGEATRHKAWIKALESTEPCVVIGPRSALFMPLRNIGLIVVDECHEPSYKQEQSPRYSALRAATVLAKLHKAKVVLGSATPAITDYYLASAASAPILKLTMPVVSLHPVTTTIIDAKNRNMFRKHYFLSDQLIERMAFAIENNQQTLLFHNRRGSAPTTLCEHCGWLAECPRCILPLTLHADQHKLRCHLCDFYQTVPPSCPVCHEPTIAFKGVGTKLIETEVHKLFPKANIARFDADNNTEDAIHNRYQDLYKGVINIIIGTQMLAKGFDLPNLTTVGIVQADNGLLIPDYQADERVFQLISQVIGRVGRQQHAGEVIIQTYQPDHPVIKAAIQKDYSGFYKTEVAKRQKSRFPPFRYLLKLTCGYKTEKGAINASQKLAIQLRKQHPNLEILGPAPAFYERLGGAFRWQLIIKSHSRSELVAIANNMQAPWQFDIDPASLL